VKRLESRLLIEKCAIGLRVLLVSVHLSVVLASVVLSNRAVQSCVHSLCALLRGQESRAFRLVWRELGLTQIPLMVLRNKEITLRAKVTTLLELTVHLLNQTFAIEVIFTPIKGGSRRSCIK
jgi:hypothetical protein